MINDRVSSNFLGSMNNLTNTSLRIATLQTIDYIRGSMKPEILSLRSNAMLTTAICGARQDEPSSGVQLAAHMHFATPSNSTAKTSSGRAQLHNASCLRSNLKLFGCCSNWKPST
ncbi:hypothetical protein EDD17DRAFT_635765 [Pisolithus thermaeus]|nr:hypothetical protein EDD17DRAFT_635765 [Pisolithus thermaeus]